MCGAGGCLQEDRRTCVSVLSHSQRSSLFKGFFHMKCLKLSEGDVLLQQGQSSTVSVCVCVYDDLFKLEKQKTEIEQQ